MPFIDLHCDTLSRLLADRRAGGHDTLRAGLGGHLSLEKLQNSGYLLQAFALFVDKERTADPLAEALAQADLFRQAAEANRDLLRPVLSFSDLEEARARGQIGALLTVEEGAVFRGDPDLLRRFHSLGVRLVTLTWNYPNELGFPNGQRGGLTDRGFEFLAEMERLHILPDVSHLGDDGFWDLCRAAKRPFLASHSCCRALRDHPRNLTDEMIRALADRGGIVGVNFYAHFLGNDPVSRTADIARHLRHIIDVGGLAAAALGSDFDGIDCPLAFGDAGTMDALVRALEGHGFTAREIEAVTWKNAWTFLKETL